MGLRCPETSLVGRTLRVPGGLCRHCRDIALEMVVTEHGGMPARGRVELPVRAQIARCSERCIVDLAWIGDPIAVAVGSPFRPSARHELHRTLRVNAPLY